MNEVLSELPEQARCQQCGYSLYRLPVDRCPECGTEFDRSAILARSQARRKKPFDKTAAAMLSAPPWWASAVALIAVTVNLGDEEVSSLDSVSPFFAAASDSQLSSVASVLLFSTAAAVFVLQIIDRIRVARRFDLTHPPKGRRFGANWIVLPIALALASPSTGPSDIGRRLTFAVSYVPMHLLAQQVVRSRGYPPDRWVGFYHAVYICPTSDGMNFRLAGHVQSGFAYTTTGRPPRCRPWAEWLGGGWYFFEN